MHTSHARSALLLAGSLFVSAAQADHHGGRASLYYSWHAVGHSIALADGTALNSGSAWGVLINRDGKGFLHEAPTSCSAAVKVVAGAAAETGYCGSTDADGDRAFMRWACSYDAKGWCIGEFDWTDGTGKYKGITGKNKIRYKGFGFRPGEATPDGIPFAVEGYSVWDVEYRIP